ncbi:RecQ family ATP-dependent DNA helicase [Propionibacteriaceae bacterium Y2011]|uniref:RecQ family ATP-dependent DNA helicase n=1 Tax=Microlunatus sp. Y2014 TaxID=3418488 RepID=UPI003B4AEE7D
MTSSAELPITRTVIESLAGPGAELRDDQATAVDHLIAPVPEGQAGARVLVVQRTGWGKSAVYWVTTALRRSEGAGPTLVVSPLLSLMRDQVTAARRAGLNAATINSSNIGDWEAIEADLAEDNLDLVLVSPERLANPTFGARVLDALAGEIGLLVIDEAHAISDWGHDFRPDYRRVADLLQHLNPATPVLATTATANQRVTDDVAAQLGSDTLVLRGPLARASLQLSVINRLDPLRRYGWVVDHLPKLAGSGIVYTLTVADAERLTEAIRTVHGDAVPVAAYHGQLGSDERERLEDDLLANRLKALVATSALGMGYDKPDLGFVVHVGSPASPVSYYQQVGRAGRGIDHAAVVLLPSPSDDGIWDYFATASIPDPDQMSRLLTALREADGPLSVPALEAETGLRRTKVELMVKQLAVDGAVDRTRDGWLATGKDWAYDHEHYESVVATRKREADIMRDYTRGRRCLMQLLQESLDDPTAAPCGRCSVCLDVLPDPLGEEPSIETVRTIATGLRARSQLLEPRKMWPGGSFGARGRIPAGLMADEGRVLVHADAPEWAETLAASSRGDEAATGELADAAVGVLARWKSDWAERPEVVVPLRTTTALDGVATAVGERLAGVGRLDRAEIEVSGPAPADDLTGPDEAAHWRSAITVPEPDAVRGRVVLLVVDRSASGWPVTVATAALRDAGASRVLPLLIHRSVG